MSIERNVRMRRWARLLLPLSGLIGVMLLLSWVGWLQGGEGATAVYANPPGSLAITMTVEAATSPVQPGDMVTYSIELEHVGGDSPAMARLTNTIPHLLQLGGPQHVQVVELAPGVSSLDVSFDEGALQWQGGLAPNAKLGIRYRALVRDCYSAQTETITNVVGAKRVGGTAVTDDADIPVTCLPTAGSGDIDVTLSVEDDNCCPCLTCTLMVEIAPTEHCLTCINFIPSDHGFFRLQITNNSPNPTVMGLLGEFTRNIVNFQPLSGGRVPDLGWLSGNPMFPALAPPSFIEGGSLPTETQTVYWLLPLAGGESQVIDLPIVVPQDAEAGATFRGQISYCVTIDGRTCPGADANSNQPPPSLLEMEPLTVAVRHRDVGDAPDSSNHHGLAMTAYTAVQANFPTVFDPSTGLPQGPAHDNPRPFHLGPRVSPEAEADLGPDRDPVNNIWPPANSPNLDRADDGVALGQLNFNNCQTSTVPVRVAVLPAAVAYFQQMGGTGYLNVWLDGIRDGDWADAQNCNGQTALEHIVRDFPIDVVTLGPGLHTILVPTALVPLPPAQQPTWLRVTLSELPAIATIPVPGSDVEFYSDGRGDEHPFKLGETEDYLYYPQGVPGHGMDIEVDLQARIRPLPDEPGYTPQTHFRFATYMRVSARNIGSAPASEYTLRLELPEGTESVQFDANPAPGITAERIGNNVFFNVAGLENLNTGLGWTGCLTCTRQLANGDVTMQLVLESNDDVNPANNEAMVSLPQPIPAPQLAWTTADHLVEAGTTCRNEIDLRGLARPNAALRIFTDGFESGDISALADGSFAAPLMLPNGRHLVRLQMLNVPETIVSNPIYVDVNNSLLFDPMVTTFTDENGLTIHPVDWFGSGGQTADRWLAHLQMDTAYTLTVGYCGEAPDPTLEFHFGAGQSVTLAHMGAGIYTGQFMLSQSLLPVGAGGALPMGIAVTTGDVTVWSRGVAQPSELGHVYDGETGQSLAAATVTALARVETAVGSDTDYYYDTWSGNAFGQINPQMTAGDGAYAFWTPPGTYQLEASLAGYQPYRSWPTAVVDELLAQPLPLTPVVTGEPDAIIEVGPEGFSQPVLALAPGTIVRFVNTDVVPHSSRGAAWDSGALVTGESYLVQLDEEGTYSYYDGATGETAVIMVGNGSSTLYLPLIVR